MDNGRIRKITATIYSNTMTTEQFLPIDSRTESLFREIRRRIFRLQSGGTLDSLKNVGADTASQIGASYVSLKQLASRYTPDEQVALMLWGTGQREEQIVACFLFPEDFNKEKITQFMPHCLNADVAGYVGSVYLYKHSRFLELVREWIASGDTFRQIAALTAAARHRIIYKKDSLLSQEEFREMTEQPYADRFVRLTAERYRL